MAAAIIPVIASTITALSPLVPPIIQGVEALFGPKTGPTKLQTAVDMLGKAAEALAAAGKIQGIPDLSTLTTLVQSSVDALKAQGQLPPPSQPTATNIAIGSRVVIVGVIQQVLA